jgi:hypothetical protein
MKKQYIPVIFLLLLGWFYPVMVYAAEPQVLVKAYFKALKNGDVQALKSYMGGKLYQKRKVLLEKNRDYPQFLIDFYKGAELEAVEVQDGIVHIKIRFPNGSLKQHNLVLQQNSYGNWIIVDELTFDR